MVTRISGQLHIITVASDPQMQRLLTLMLEHPRIRISAALCCPEALRIVRSQSSLAVLLDTHDQVEEGLALCRQLKSAPGSPIVVAFVNDRARYADFCAAGSDAVFLKPFRVRHVLARLDALLRTAHNTSLPNWCIAATSDASETPLREDDLFPRS